MAKATHPKVKPAFATALRALTEDEYNRLEASIKKYGCHDPVKTWKGWVADGHNRLKICKANGIGYKTEELSVDKYPTEAAVVIWIVSTQLSRRNLSPAHYLYLAGTQVNAMPSKTKQAKGKEGDHKKTKDTPSTEDVNLELGKQEAKEQLAEEMGVGLTTLETHAKKASEVDKLAASLKQAYLDGKVKLTADELKLLAAMPKGDQLTKWKQVKDGAKKSWGHALGLKKADGTKKLPKGKSTPKVVIGPQEVIDGFKRLSKLIDEYDSAHPNEEKREEIQSTLNIALETFDEWEQEVETATEEEEE